MWKWETMGDVKGVIVIVHGSGEHHGRYQWLRNQWLHEGFHVVQGDLPGQGANPKKRGHVDRFDEYIEAIEKWIHLAEEYKLPIFLLGHSLGGLVVIRALQEKSFPLQGVLLSSPCLGLVSPPPGPIVSAARLVDRFKPDLLVQIKKSPVNSKATRNYKILETDKDDPYLVMKVSIRWYLELDQAIKIAHKKSGQFSNYPLLILQGGDDKICDKFAAKQWFDKLNLASKIYKEWDGLYHEVFNEPEREEVFNYAKQFVIQCLS